MDLYIGPKIEAKRVFEKVSDRWEIGACLSPLDEFTQVSFVIGIALAMMRCVLTVILMQIPWGVIS